MEIGGTPVPVTLFQLPEIFTHEYAVLLHAPHVCTMGRFDMVGDIIAVMTALQSLADAQPITRHRLELVRTGVLEARSAYTAIDFPQW